MKRIYLATPYTHDLSTVKELRYLQVNQIAAQLIEQRHIVFSPITHCHELIQLADMPGDWDFWETYDRSFLEWCDELHVYKAEGWQESKGVSAEIAIAQELGKPIVYIEAEGNKCQ